MGTWIEISSSVRSWGRRSGRSLRGNVDRNFWASLPTTAPAAVVPYVGTWIEIPMLTLQQDEFCRRSLRGNVDRNDCVGSSAAANYCRSLRGNVDRNIDDQDDVDLLVPSFPTWERG